MARHPVLFVGHGSPMNAIEDNVFSRGHAALARLVPRPRAILAAHAAALTGGSAADGRGLDHGTWSVLHRMYPGADVARALETRDEAWLVRALDTPEGRRAHPTTEHWLPILYAVGASDAGDAVRFPLTGFDLGSLSMRGVLFT